MPFIQSVFAAILAAAVSAVAAPCGPAPVNDGTQPGVEGSGEWIDVYEPVDLTGPVQIRTATGTVMTPTDEGAVSTIDDPATSNVPTTWRLDPVGNGRHQLRSDMTTDGRPTCLNVHAPETVGLEICDAGQPTQTFVLTTTETTSTGTPASFDFDHGSLAVDPDGAVTTGGSAPFLLTAP